MKMKGHYIIGMLSLALVTVSCEKYEPDFFDEGANGAYFDYEYAADFDKTLNFSDHIVENSDTVSVMLKVKLLGYLMEEKRTLDVKTKTVEGYPLADVTIDDVVFADEEYEKNIEVRVRRPEMEDTMYAICIYLDGSGEIGAGISGKEEINLYVVESYTKPSMWESHVPDLLGAWSKEKHIFLARHTGDNHFYEKFGDGRGGYSYESIMAVNVSAVNALLADKDSVDGALKDSIALMIEIPILSEDKNPDYGEPFFWKDYRNELGSFRADKLCHLVNDNSKLGGVNTRELLGLFGDDEGVKKVDEAAKVLNAELVVEMLAAYNNYAQEGYSMAEYDTQYYRVNILNQNYKNIDTTFWWKDPKGLGTTDVVKKYFGEYSLNKYQFMLKTMSVYDGADVFMAASIFPFIYDKETGTWDWDPTPSGPNGLPGEERLKECYRIIKEANDKRIVKFDIPDVEL